MRIRTAYSFNVATGHLQQVMEHMIKCEYPVFPISDRMSTFGFTRWNKLCAKNKLTPAFGVELAVVPRLGERKPLIDYWTFFAKDNIGDLNRLVMLATSNPGKEPSLTYAMALNAPGVIKIAGERVQVQHLKPAKDFYFALSPSLSKGLYNQLKDKYQCIASSDNFFTHQEDLEFYRVTLGRRANTQTYDRFIQTDKEWNDSVAHIADAKTRNLAFTRRNTILSSLKAVLPKAELFIPKKKQSLMQMCVAGAKAKNCNLKNPMYKKRLEYELDLIAQKKFDDYFYIIADLVTWAKKHMIVGPARGSSCGSLVCYLLSITEIDPIPYGLIFERFIDLNRLDLPDIDIDFSDEKRELVFNYAKQQFGAENIARLGTVSFFKSKSALKRVSDSLWIPSWMADKVEEGVIKRSSGDARAMATLEDAFANTPAGQELMTQYPEARIATMIEGHPSNSSQHAAGIVVTKRPIIEYVAIDSRTNSAMCDKKDAEDLNLLKIDALGLTQLSIFENVARRIGKPDKSGWLEKLPLNDQKAFDVLNKRHYAGIFQFQGIALQAVTNQIKITNIEDIISLTALARPGPLATGGTMTWVRRRNKKEEVHTEHPMLTELTKSTYGVVVYQETVMQIARVMGKLSWEDTSELRKAMSRSLGEEFFDKYKERFLAGAKENKIPDDTARLIWKNINTFGNWAFNRSHAVAYGIVSYWCCWLKAHYPLEFAAASLDAESDPTRQILFLRELAAEGIKYIPIDPDKSIDKWLIKGKTLIGPLTNANGIGPAALAEILDARKKNLPLRDTLLKRIKNVKTNIDSIFPITDAIRRICPDLTKLNIVSKPTPIIRAQCGVEGSVVVIGVADKIQVKDLNEHINVEKRGYEIKGPNHYALNMFLSDDTDRMLCRINRQDFNALAKPIVERGGVGKSIYAIKGTIPKDFRMISVRSVRYLGTIDGETYSPPKTRASEGRKLDSANTGVSS